MDSMASASRIDDLYVAPYDAFDPKNEPHPDHVIYQPEFRDLRSLQKHVIALFLETLSASKYHNPTTRILLELVRKIDKGDNAEQTMFAVCGNMGLGKSALINSLLSAGNFARSGASGDSCTWVVQRFMQQFPGQTSPFAAKVFLYSPEEICKIIASLLVKYFRAIERTRFSDDDNDDDEPEPESEEMRSDSFTDRQTVLDTLLALFGDRPEFFDEQAAETYLSMAKTETDELLCSELSGWADTLTAKFLGGNDYVLVEASTDNELLFKLAPFAYQLGGDEGRGQVSPWPLVNVIDFGLDNPLLNEGIVLVDTPGLSDSDSTRAANAARYHRMCTHKITVGDVIRAKNDKTLRESLIRGYRYRRSAGTLLVLTRGDTIDGGTVVTGGRLEKEGELELNQALKELKDNKQALLLKRKSAVMDESFRIDNELQAIATDTRVKELEYNRIRACMRNDSVAKAISDFYHKMTSDPHPLAVFVVGNEAYQQHQAGHTVDEKPFLSVEETKIPALRAKISNLPADGKLNDAMHLANVHLPNLINYFELYCSKTHMDRKGDIEKLILQPSKDIKAVLQSTSERLVATVERHISSPMTQVESQWVKQARRLCRTWAVKSSRDNLLLMKKEGYKKGRKDQPDVSWNKDLMEMACVKHGWEDEYEAFNEQLKHVCGELWSPCAGMLDTMRANISGNPQFNVMALRPFLDTFSTERENMKAVLNGAFRALRGDAATIQQDCVVPTPTAFLFEAMRPLYAEVIQVKGGQGAPQKRMQLLERRLTSMSGVWMKVHDSTEIAFAKAIGQCIKRIEKGMLGVFGNINKKFALLCDERIITDPDEKEQEEKLRAKLQATVNEARELLKGPIQKAVTSCTAYGKEDENWLFMGKP